MVSLQATELVNCNDCNGAVKVQDVIDHYKVSHDLELVFERQYKPKDLCVWCLEEIPNDPVDRLKHFTHREHGRTLFEKQAALSGEQNE